MYIGSPLEEETVTNTALNTICTYEEDTAITRRQSNFVRNLDDLYGAGFGFDIYKRGDYQIVQFRMDIIDDRYVKSSMNLIEAGT